MQELLKRHEIKVKSYGIDGKVYGLGFGLYNILRDYCWNYVLPNPVARVYLELNSYWGVNDICNPALETIAMGAGLEKTDDVEAATNLLTAMGFIGKIRGNYKLEISNEYSFQHVFKIQILEEVDYLNEVLNKIIETREVNASNLKKFNESIEEAKKIIDDIKNNKVQKIQYDIENEGKILGRQTKVKSKTFLKVYKQLLRQFYNAFRYSSFKENVNCEHLFFNFNSADSDNISRLGKNEPTRQELADTGVYNTNYNTNDNTNNIHDDEQVCESDLSEKEELVNDTMNAITNFLENEEDVIPFKSIVNKMNTEKLQDAFSCINLLVYSPFKPNNKVGYLYKILNDPKPAAAKNIALHSSTRRWN